MRSRKKTNKNTRRPPAPGAFRDETPGARKLGIGDFDLSLLIYVAILAGIGLVMVYSSSGVFAYALMDDTSCIFDRQVKWLAFALLIMFVTAVIDYRYYTRLAPYILGASIFLLVLAPLIGVEISGAKRWLSIGGFRFHVGEPSKIVMVIVLAVFLSKYKNRIRDIRIPAAAVGALVVIGGLLMLQPDFGMTAMVGLICMVMLFVAGARVGHLLSIGALGAFVSIPLVMAGGYRLNRLIGFFTGGGAHDVGFQGDQAVRAIASGGIFGRGLGNSLQKRFYLPQQSSDFIYSIIGEELGLIGMAIVALLFVLLSYRGLKIAAQCDDPLGVYLAVGITWMISFQAALNMAVATGLSPVTGTPLPFISVGGTSLCCMFAGIGILLNISSQKRSGRSTVGGGYAESIIGGSRYGRTRISGGSPRRTLAGAGLER